VPLLIFEKGVSQGHLWKRGQEQCHLLESRFTASGRASQVVPDLGFPVIALGTLLGGTLVGNVDGCIRRLFAGVQEALVLLEIHFGFQSHADACRTSG